MIEAMACGCPVIAYNRGALPEVIEEGVTGFLVDDEVAASAAVGRLGTLSRRAIRKRFEARFTARRMADDYLALYRELIDAAFGTFNTQRASARGSRDKARLAWTFVIGS